MNKQQATVTDNSAIIANQIMEQSSTPSNGAGEQSIKTRFGQVTVNRDNPISFPKGLLGMPDKTSFTLCDFPVDKFAQFKLLQSLEDDSLSFITLPLELENPIIARSDIEDGCADLGIELDDLALLLVVSVHRDMQNVRLSANTRAPLFMSADRRIAEQYVLRNNKYNVRHMITA